jgi:hypothetical protein
VEVKFLLDRLRGRNRFLFHGRKVRHLAAAPAPDGKPRHIVMPTIFFLDRGIAWQSVIARALELRGNRVTFLPQNLSFPRRNTLYFDEHDWGFAMPFYSRYTRALLSGFEFTIRPYGEFGTVRDYRRFRHEVKSLDLAGCRALTYCGLPLGRMAENNVMHYFRCGPERWTERMLEAYRDFLAQGMVLHAVLVAAFDALAPDVIFTLNGSFLDSQLQLALARARGIRVVTYEAGFMLNSIILGVNEPIVDFPLAKYLPGEYATYQLSDAQERELDQYLNVRRLGKESVFDYWGNPILDMDTIRHDLGLSTDGVPDILFTNLLWDSAMLNCDIAFSSQRDWIVTTIEFYRAHPERTLLLRIHPAEVTPPHLESTDKVGDMLAAEYPQLPPNVIVIPPESTISSYPLTEISNLALVYSSTAGLEAATMGKPVLVAGRCHFRGQGFTRDITSREQYQAMLAGEERVDDPAAVRTLARKYAYFFFFGFMVPFPLVTERVTTTPGDLVSFNYASEEQLLPGRDPGLDFTLGVLAGETDYRARLARLML